MANAAAPVATKELRMQEALREALRSEMARDERVFVMGEDVALFGGAYGVTRGLIQEFGEKRVLDTPISESALVGLAVGSAINGMRPVVEIQFADLLPLAMDQLASHAARYHYMTGGRINVPMVIRTKFATRAGGGPSHSSCNHGAFIHFPGLKIAMPTTPADAKGMLLSAIRDPNPVPRHHLLTQCEASLRRLRTDRIDLYQVHEWDGQTPLDETLAALDDLVRAGKVRYVGCSNYAGWQLMKALGVAERRGLDRFCSQQIHYTLQAREAEYELVPIAVDQGLGTLVWSPLAGGLLTGKYRRDQPDPEQSRLLSGWDEPPVRDQDKLYDIVETLVAVAADRGASPAQVALAWLLARPAVTSVIIGARTSEQLADNLGAADLTLSEEELARLEEVSRPPLLYPYWHQAKTATDRLGPADLTLLGPHLSG